MRVWIGRENVSLYHSLDWEQEVSRFQEPDLNYPEYYTSQNFHGIPNGYLNPVAPVTYDAVTAVAAPPNETQIRQQAIAKIQGQPRRILDLGCGTGTSTLALAHRFPDAEITAIDLSPYMLVYAEQKAQATGALQIHFQQGLAEQLPFAPESFDLVSVSFLFHEVPPEISKTILRECYRVLQHQGQVLVVDGHQQKLRSAGWAIKLFREPYSAVYAEGDVKHWLEAAGFVDSFSQNVGWISQIFSGFKFQGLHRG